MAGPAAGHDASGVDLHTAHSTRTCSSSSTSAQRFGLVCGFCWCWSQCLLLGVRQAAGRGPTHLLCTYPAGFPPAAVPVSCLRSVEFGAILLWFFLCDRTNMLWQAEKVRAQVWLDS